MIKKYKFIYVKLGNAWQPWEKDGEFYEGGFVLDWAAEKMGFGQLTFYNKGDITECSTECMSKGFVKEALNFFYNNLKLVK